MSEKPTGTPPAAFAPAALFGAFNAEELEAVEMLLADVPRKGGWVKRSTLKNLIRMAFRGGVAAASGKTNAEALAMRFHEAYERLAPEYGYKTRKASAVAWESVPQQNKRLMIAVCSELLSPNDQTERRGPATLEHQKPL